MKSPPRDELNPIRGLLGTRDDFPPVTDNRKTVRPRGRPLIILMYASLTPASSAKDRMAPAEWGVEGRGLYAHVYERQPSVPPVPEGPLRISPTAVWATAGRSAERRGKKKKKTAAQPAAAIYHNGARVRISARPHALPAFATGASRRQKVTGGKRDCRQAAKQDAQNAALEGKMDLGVTVKNCFSKVPQNVFLWQQRQLI